MSKEDDLWDALMIDNLIARIEQRLIDDYLGGSDERLVVCTGNKPECAFHNWCGHMVGSSAPVDSTEKGTDEVHGENVSCRYPEG